MLCGIGGYGMLEYNDALGGTLRIRPSGWSEDNVPGQAYLSSLCFISLIVHPHNVICRKVNARCYYELPLGIFNALYNNFLTTALCSKHHL